MERGDARREIYRVYHAALRSGTLKRPDHCSECGRECTPDGHHMDYSKPLLVVWLCRDCHQKHHSHRLNFVASPVRSRRRDRRVSAPRGRISTDRRSVTDGHAISKAIREVLREALDTRGVKPATASKRAGIAKNTAKLHLDHAQGLTAESLVKLVRDGIGMRFDDFAHAVERRLQESGQ
jgi:hypothetical protein